MITHDSSGTTMTGDAITVYAVLVIRRGLILRIDTGMSLTRRSALSVAQQRGLTTRRTYRGALQDVNAWLGSQGVGSVWSKAHPEG